MRYGTMSAMSSVEPPARRRATGPAQRPAATGAPHRISDYADRVLSAVEAVPPGLVTTYGDIARRLGTGGPRQVGRVLAEYGGAVPWWRVVRSDGRLLADHEHRALERYRVEGTPLRGDGGVPRLDMRRARWTGEPEGAGGVEETEGAERAEVAEATEPGPAAAGAPPGARRAR